ncbi:MAG: hypothetical protein ACI9XJ_002705 [Marivirga sp.]|jgi:uncharacterized protein YbjT (DUF2867 family)
MNKTACILGASGLVGGHLLDLLAEQDAYAHIKVINRRSLGISDAKIEEIIIEDFDKLDEYVAQLKADDYYCCLGTTIKKAGSKEAFKKVDFDYVVNIAAVAKENDAHTFSVVSAMGAKAGSMIFYNSVKGEMEDAVIALKNTRTFILRPSLIAGERKEQRAGEDSAQWVFKKLNFLFQGPLKKYGAVEAKQIAYTMVKNALDNESSIQIIESDKIQETA